MSSSFGKNIHISVFGQSHSEKIGVVVDGLPAGEVIDMDKIYTFMKRRVPGQNTTSTSRSEADIPEILSGIIDNKTCGSPLCITIKNTDIKSSDYDELKNIPRPSHADFSANIKHDGHNDIRGGGHFSGRLTAPLCFAGAVCIQLLEKKGINIAAHIQSISDIKDDIINPVSDDLSKIKSAGLKEFPVINDKSGEKMKELILAAKENGDSVGGVVECIATGMPAGIGDPIFDGIESRISGAIFSIPAVRALSFGEGFSATKMLGSEHNDSFFINGKGEIKTITNHHAGILGGITTGMPIVFHTAFKPTPSIALPQQSVNLTENKITTLNIKGRHDPCIVPRAVVCVEAITAIVLLDSIL